MSEIATLSQLDETLYGRQQAIAKGWCRVIDSPERDGATQSQLESLASQVITLAYANSIDSFQAQTIGASLASSGLIPIEAWGKIVEILMHELTKGLDAEQIVAIQPRLSKLVGELTAGFVSRARRNKAPLVVRDSEALMRKVIDATPASIFVKDQDGRYILANQFMADLYGMTVDQLLGKTDLDFVERSIASIEEHERFKATDHATLVTQQPQFIPKQSVNTIDGLRWFQTVKVPLTLGGKPQYVLGVASDITERMRAQEALERSTTRLTLINDIGRRIAAVLELDSVLERAAHLVQESFGYHHVALFTLDQENHTLVMRAKAGDFAHLFPAGHQLKLGQGMVGWASLHGETILANDVESEKHYINLYPDMISTLSELSVPIRIGQQVVGVLDVQSPERHAFEREDVMALETLADQIAIAIDNARLYEEVQQKLVERVRVEGLIQQSLEEKEVLLREIHHRVKNNLAIISSLLELQSGIIQDDGIREVFRESQNRIRSMARIHQHLYQSQDLAQIAMAGYIQDLALHLRQSYGAYKIDVQIIAENVTLDIDTAIPCGLITNELVSNALKYAFTPDVDRPPAQENQIRVTLGSDQQLFELTVSDNGVPLPADFDLENPDTLGLKLVQMLVRQLGGSIRLDKSENGKSFWINFPYRG